MGGPLLDDNGNPIYGPPALPEPPPAPVAEQAAPPAWKGSEYGIPAPEQGAPGFQYDNSAKLSDGPIALARKAYHNATRGYGVAGLASPDGSLAGAVDETLTLGLYPTGGATVTAARDLRDGTDHLKPKGDASILGNPGDKGDRTANDDENEDIVNLGRLYQGGGPAGATPAPYFQQEGSSKAGIGGPALYDEAFKGAPGRREQAMRELGVIQEDRAKELSKLYDQQAAQDQASAEAMAVKAQREQDDLALRQQDIEKATKFYSRDLADSGKFWANPGNIVAAISYSLMPIFSNDPTVGVKLINQAVQQDLDNRTRAADQNLGNMRAGLDGYRKIAGDRQQGDLLARAEAHRMAAQEIQRIGSKFAGPEAAKQMQVSIEDQKTRASAAEMEFNAKYIHTPAKRTVPQETAALYKGPGGWAPLGQQPGQQQGPASPVNGDVQGSPSQISNKGFKNPAIAAIARVGGAPAVDRLLSDPRNAGKVSDRDAENVAIMLVRQQADAEKKPYIKVLMEQQKELQPVVMELQKTAGRRKLISGVLGTMEVIERTELAAGEDPEKFLSWARTAWPRSWVQEYEKFTAKDPRMIAPGSAEQAAKFRDDKVKELHAALAGVYNVHNHDLFGGAQTATGPGGGEIGRGAEEIGPKSSFHQIKAFLGGQSQQLQAQASSLKSGLTPIQRVLLRVGDHGGMSDAYLPRKEVPGASK